MEISLRIGKECECEGSRNDGIRNILNMVIGFLASYIPSMLFKKPPEPAPLGVPLGAPQERVGVLDAGAAQHGRPPGAQPRVGVWHRRRT